MDHYQTRFPTNVLDIAGFLVRLASKDHFLLSLLMSQTDGPFFSSRSRKAKGFIATSRDSLLGRGALHKIRNLSRFRTYPRPSACAHHT